MHTMRPRALVALLVVAGCPVDWSADDKQEDQSPIDMDASTQDGSMVPGQPDSGPDIPDADVEASLERLRQSLEMVFRAGEFNVRCAQVHFTGHNLQPFVSRRFDLVLQRALAQQHSIGAGSSGPAFFLRP